jgi:putrescine transport system ATP-binding protein
MLGGVVKRVGAERVRLEAQDGLVVDAANSADVAVGQEAWFALRPEKVRISHDPPEDASRNAVQGEVWDIAYLGDMSLYNVKLASGTIVRASRLNASRSVEKPIGWEDHVWLSWPADSGVILAQ